MSVRVTATEVKEIIETDITDSTIDVYITSANALVNKALGTSSLGTALLKEIERWLTAHMIASTKERQTKKEEAGTAKVEYTGDYGEGLASTSYGQMVMGLDTTGGMAKLGKKVIMLKAITANKY